MSSTALFTYIVHTCMHVSGLKLETQRAEILVRLYSLNGMDWITPKRQTQWGWSMHVKSRFGKGLCTGRSRLWWREYAVFLWLKGFWTCCCSDQSILTVFGVTRLPSSRRLFWKNGHIAWYVQVWSATRLSLAGCSQRQTSAYWSGGLGQLTQLLMATGTTSALPKPGINIQHGRSACR